MLNSSIKLIKIIVTNVNVCCTPNLKFYFRLSYIKRFLLTLFMLIPCHFLWVVVKQQYPYLFFNSIHVMFVTVIKRKKCHQLLLELYKYYQRKLKYEPIKTYGSL